VHVFIVRRLLLLAIGLFLYKRPPLQLVAINAMNIAVIIYLGLFNPLKGRLEKRMDLFNESMVALVTYHLFMFTDALPDKAAQYLIGWSFVANLTAMLAVNAYFVGKNTIRRTYLLGLQNWRIREHKKALKARAAKMETTPYSEIPQEKLVEMFKERLAKKKEEEQLFRIRLEKNGFKRQATKEQIKQAKKKVKDSLAPIREIPEEEERLDFLDMYTQAYLVSPT